MYPTLLIDILPTIQIGVNKAVIKCGRFRDRYSPAPDALIASSDLGLSCNKLLRIKECSEARNIDVILLFFKAVAAFFITDDSSVIYGYYSLVHLIYNILGVSHHQDGSSPYVDLFEKLGLKVPTTKTELLDVCQKLLDNGVAPWAQWYADGASVDIEVRIVLWTEAVKDGKLDMFEKLMKGEAKLADYPYFQKAVEVWGERIGAGKGWALPEAVANDQTAGNEAFISGKAGMLYQGTWNIGTIEEKIAGSDFRYGFFLCPTDDSGEIPTLNTQVDQAFMINPQGKNAAWAQKFMEYWLSEEMGFWSDATYQPCITGATTENTPALLQSLLAAKATGNTAGYGNFTMSFSSAFIKAYRKALTAYATWACTGVETSGVKDAETCIKYMQELFDEEIAQAAL